MCSSCNLTKHTIINNELTDLMINNTIDCINNKENKIITNKHQTHERQTRIRSKDHAKELRDK